MPLTDMFFYLTEESRYALLAGPPSTRRQTSETFKISAVRVTLRVRPLLKQLVQVLHQNGPDRVKTLMPTQALRLKPRQRSYDHVLAERELVLHNDVDDGMQLVIGHIQDRQE